MAGCWGTGWYISVCSNDCEHIAVLESATETCGRGTRWHLSSPQMKASKPRGSCCVLSWDESQNRQGAVRI